MIHLQHIGGISFTKGCYPGQEIVARTQYLGKIKKRLQLLSHPLAAHDEEAQVLANRLRQAQLVAASAEPKNNIEAAVSPSNQGEVVAAVVLANDAGGGSTLWCLAVVRQDESTAVPAVCLQWHKADAPPLQSADVPPWQAWPCWQQPLQVHRLPHGEA